MVPKGCQINHPLGFIWYPLEGAGPNSFFEPKSYHEAVLFSGSYHSGGQQSFLGVRLDFLGYGWIEGGNLLVV